MKEGEILFFLGFFMGISAVLTAWIILTLKQGR